MAIAHLTRQAERLENFNVEELLKLITETHSLGAAHRMAQIAIQKIEDERDQYLLSLAEQHNSQTALENGWF